MKKRTHPVIESLKGHLRARNLSYRELARAWELSEASVKRLMSGDDLSLSKVEAACRLLGLPVGEFYAKVNFEKGDEFFHLSLEQESKLAALPELLHFFLLLEADWTPARIVRAYSITAAQKTRFLVQLDRLGLIELLPKDKVRRMHPGRLRFRRDGPLRQTIEKYVRGQFLDSSFLKENEYMGFVLLNLPPAEVDKLKIRFVEFLTEAVKTGERHRGHPNAEDFGLILAMRPWSLPLLEVLPRRKTK